MASYKPNQHGVVPAVEKRLRHDVRISRARAWFEEHGTKPRKLDFSQCATRDECDWYTLGGHDALETFRALTSGDEGEEISALTSLAARFGEEPPSGEDEIEMALVSLGLDPRLAKCTTAEEAAEISRRKT
jgi:hypothetical protein